jgi:putative transposase
MANTQAESVNVGEKAKGLLKQIIRQQNTPQWLVTRATIILRAAAGQSNSQIARELGSTRNPVIKWRRRWRENSEVLAAMEEEGVGDKELRQSIESSLADAPRSGAPPTFTAEQIVQIVAVSCEKPEQMGRPVTHWTPGELADEVVKRGIVKSISPRQVGRFLKGGRPEAASDALLAE